MGVRASCRFESCPFRIIFNVEESSVLESNLIESSVTKREVCCGSPVWLERESDKLEVEGSNPSRSTIFRKQPESEPDRRAGAVSKAVCRIKPVGFNSSALRQSFKGIESKETQRKE